MDYVQKIVEYLKKNLKKGYTLESLKWALIDQGYTRTSIENAIKQLNIELAKQAPILKEKPKIKYEIIDEYDKPITIKKPFWKRIFS
jgi:hypothetical protein